MTTKVQNWLFKLSLTIPFFYWLYLMFLTDLGGDPAKKLNHKTGEMAFYFLVANLVIGVLIALKVKMPNPLRFLYLNRRFLGIITFFYLVMHLSFYLAMEGFEFKAIEQMYTKLYLIFATAAWVLFLILTLTSNDLSVKKLTLKKWKLLHKVVYVGFALVAAHVLLIEKTDLIKYGLFAISMIVLQGFRFYKSKSVKS